jgi:hypothetical protein
MLPQFTRLPPGKNCKMRDTVKKCGDDFFNFPRKLANFIIGILYAKTNEKDALVHYFN